MSDTTGKGTPSGNPTFSGPDKYASTTMSVKSLNTKSYQPTASIAQVQGGLTPGSFAVKVMDAKPTMKSPLFQPVGSEVKRPKIDPETQKLIDLGKLAEEYGITFTTDAEGNKALEIPPDFVDTEPDPDNAPEQRVTVLQEMIPLAVEYGELRKEMLDELKHISDPSAKTVVQTLIEECDMLIKLEDPTKEQVEQLKTNLGDLKGKRHFIVQPKEEPVVENEAAVAPTTTELSPEPATNDSKESVSSTPAAPETEDAKDPFSEENVQKEMENTKLGEGRVVAALEKDGEGNDIIVRYEIQGYNTASKKITLRNMQTGETKEEFPGRVKRALAEQEIHYRLKKEAERKEKDVPVVKTSAPEKILPEKTETAEKETTPEKRGEKYKEDSRRFEIGEVVHLINRTGVRESWKIKDFERKGPDLFVIVEKSGKTNRIEVRRLKKFVKDAEEFEKEKGVTPQENKKERKESLHRPIKEFYSALNNPQHASKQLMGWYRVWVKSGKIDDYRKEYANVAVSDATLAWARGAFPVYAEALGTKGLSGDLKRSSEGSLKQLVRELTGIIEEDREGLIEYNIENSVTAEGNLAMMKEAMAEAKLKETQEQAATKTILRPAGAFKVGQTLNLRGRGNIKVTKENVDDLNREFEEKKLGQTRVAAHEKELADRETLEMYRNGFYLDTKSFLDLYTKNWRRPDNTTFRTANEMLKKHPKKEVIRKVLHENGVDLIEETPEMERMYKEQTLRLTPLSSLEQERRVYAPSAGNKESDWRPETEESKKNYPVSHRQEHVEEINDKKPKMTESQEKEQRVNMTNIRDTVAPAAQEYELQHEASAREAAPSKKSKGVQGVLSLFEKQRGKSWEAWAVAIGLGTVIGVASAKPPAERILDSSATYTASQDVPWKELFLERSKNRESAEVFAEDVVSLNSEALMRKYAQSHFSGHNDPTKMRLALNWRGEDLVRDNTGEHFGHLSNKERVEFSDLWDLLQKISISIQGHPLQSRTYEDAIKEAKQLISSRT